MYKIALILDNIRSTHNVGSILRSADGFGVAHVYFSGYTPYPHTENDQRLPHEAQKLSNAIAKTALGAEKTISFSLHETCFDAVTSAKNAGYHIAALEQSPHSISLPDYCAQTNIAVILGNEVTGIVQDHLERADIVLEIPMQGKKESFNVGVSAAVCLYALNHPCKQIP